MGVVIVAAEGHLFCGKTAAHFQVPFQDENLLTRFAQVGGNAKPVGAASDDDEVILFHSSSSVAWTSKRRFRQ